MRSAHGSASPTVIGVGAVSTVTMSRAVVLSTWSCVSTAHNVSPPGPLICDADALAMAITIAAPLAADRVRRCSAVVANRLGENASDGKAMPQSVPSSPAPSSLSLAGHANACNDRLSASGCGAAGSCGGKLSNLDWSMCQDRDGLMRRIAELEALFDASIQRETTLSNKIENARDLLECSICFLPLCWPVSLRCSHSFCSACVAKWEMSTASVSKSLTCPVCRAPGGPPMPARALNDVCRAMEDEETAQRRKEDVGAYHKYEAALRERTRMEARARDARDDMIPITLRPEPQAVLAALGLSRPAVGLMAAAQADAIAMQSETREFTARPTGPAVDVRTGGERPEAPLDGLAIPNAHLQMPSSNSTNVRAEDVARVHTPRGRAAHRMTLSSFLEAERS